MKRSRAALAFALVVIPLLGCTLMAWLDCSERLPLLLRDRPLALVAVALSAAAVACRLTWSSRRGRLLSAVGGVTSIIVACVAAWLVRARYELPPSSPLARIGDHLPSVSLRDESGREVALSEVTGRPTLIIWFRGSWCPYCRKQLAELAPTSIAYADTVRVIAVAAEAPQPLKQLQGELQLPFTLLSDPDGTFMRQCDSSHCVAIVDSNGVIRWSVVSGSWAQLPPATLLQNAFEAR